MTDLPALATAMSSAIAQANRAIPHAEWKRALYPVAMAAIGRGEIECLPHHKWRVAEITASFAATDMVLEGRTLLLPMDEVLAAQPIIRTVERIVGGSVRMGKAA
jgi:hypothetical protein